MYTVKVGLPEKKMRKRSTENLKASDLYNGTEASCNDKEQYLFLP